MKLLGTTTSPYTRKVRLVLHEKGIPCAFVAAPPRDAGSPVPAANPLGRVPTLLLDDGSAVWDSPVICEYLDALRDAPVLVPRADAAARMRVRRWEALADGIAAAALGIVVEGRRPPAQQSGEWIERQRQKIDAGVAELARDLAEKNWCNGEGFTLADIATGCTLGYLDLRHPAIDWRGAYANLGRHYDKLARRPSFQDTAPPAA
jgi:glutathione S-transferase